jgi:hypothetical protein
MSISCRFFEQIKARGNWLEIFFYRERCMFNTYPHMVDEPPVPQDVKENFLDQAHRLDDLIEQLSRKQRKERRKK